MTSLNRKLFRDLLQTKGQALAISLVIACGIGTFVMSLAAMQSLVATQTKYYSDSRFADVFARLKRAPRTLRDRIAEIPGVATVQTRTVVDVTLDVPGMRESAVGRLISMPDTGEPLLNKLHLRSGRSIAPGQDGEAVVSEAFAQAHALEPGDEVTAIINSRREKLRIVGIVLSPEYVLQMRGGDILPDEKRFGVFWMREDDLNAAYNMEGAFNDVTLSLMRDASQPAVIQQLDALIEPYGGVGSYGRDDQISHRYLSDEIKQLQGMGVIAPMIFLGVAAFLLNVVLSRIISTQREQIAALKAFGYTNLEVGSHYLKLVLLISSVGVVFGCVMGAWLGRGMTEIYAEFYRFPRYYFSVSPMVVASACIISLAAGAVGTIGAVRRAVSLPPAEAMRPEAPPTFKPTIFERLGFQHLMTQTPRMVLRQLERRPWKTALSAVGIAMATSVLVLGNFSLDALSYLIEFQFHWSQRQDMTVAFVEPRGPRVLHEVGRMPGVMHVESFRSVPVRIHHGHLTRRLGIVGLPPDASLMRLLDRDGKPITLPRDGLVLSQKLGEVLHVSVGDNVLVNVQEGERPTRTLPVVGLLNDFAGTNAYMDKRALHQFMQEGPQISGVYMSVDEAQLDALYDRIKNTPGIASVAAKQATIESFNDTVAKNQLTMQGFMVMFASVIAFGVVYNTARISLSERSRELATLRVIGFSRAEISAILLGELGLLTVLGVPLGLLMGYGLAFVVSMGANTEMYRIPLVVAPSTYGFAAVVTIIASIVSGLIVRRKLDHLDLVAVLKSRE